jgi:prevent-host-death family protein
VRTLRADLASSIRRAAHGERIVVTVGGTPAAVLGPLTDQAPDLERLAAAGAVLPPRRTSRWRPPAPVTVWAGIRIDQALRDVRG